MSGSFVVPGGEGQRVELGPVSLTIRVPSSRVGGAFSVVDFTAAPGFRAPPVLHKHADMDWSAHVLSGAAAMQLDDRQVRVDAGGLVVIRRGTAFRWWNASDTEPVRWLLTYTPGGFEQYFLDLAQAFSALGRPPTPADLAAVVPPLWAKHGVEIVPG